MKPWPKPVTAKTVLLGATLAAALVLGACGGGSAGEQASGSASVALAASTYSTTAGTGTVAVAVDIARSGVATGAVSVSYATEDGNAIAGTDYQPASGTLSWASGDSASKTISIRLLPGATASRSFTLQLTGASGASLGQPAAASVALTAAPAAGGGGTSGTATLALATSSYSVTVGAASTPVSVKLSRSGTGSGAVSVRYATVAGTAVAGTDFQASSGSLTWSAGDSATKSVSIALLPGATGGRSFSLQLSGATGGTLAQPATAVVSLVAAATPVTPVTPVTPPVPVAPAAALKIISRGVPAYASSGTASMGNDANYNHTWRSAGLPATLAYDLSATSPAPSAVLVAWYNDNSYGYDHAQLGSVGYNNAGSYTIEVNAAPGGGSAPTSGWQAVATVAGNTLHSRQHYVQFAGYHWIRINATASDGSAGNTDVNIKMDVYDASNGVGDGWFFGGDSITANCMGHGTKGGSAYDSFGSEVAAAKGIVPPQENAGMPGWDALGYGQRLAAWLAATPSRYVTLNLGTNDAAGGIAPATYYARMESMVKAVIAAGKVPVVPTIPWSPEPTHAANLPGLNAQIQALYAAYPQVRHGPDLYGFFQMYPNYISSDNVHPTAAGCAALRSQWAQFAISSVY